MLYLLLTGIGYFVAGFAFAKWLGYKYAMLPITTIAWPVVLFFVLITFIAQKLHKK